MENYVRELPQIFNIDLIRLSNLEKKKMKITILRHGVTERVRIVRGFRRLHQKDL